MTLGRLFVVCAILTSLVTGGCVASQAHKDWPEPAALGHLDITMKKAYIANTKATLKVYRKTASDLLERGKPASSTVLGNETDKFVTLYVRPILDDEDAGTNLETKLEIAKLHLLCGFIFAETGRRSQAKAFEREFEDRYGENVSMLNATIAEADLGFTTLEEGKGRLRAAISRI